MKLEAEQVLCRIHVSSLARHGSEPLHEWIVETARREDLQGATVLEGFMGLQADGTIVHEHARSASREVPVVVEVVDGPRHVEKLLAQVEPAMRQGTITLERAHVALYRSGEAGSKPRDVAPRYDVVATQDASAALEVKTMKIPEKGVLLRVFIGESDRWEHKPLYEAIVLKAREMHLAGATVLRGPMGFGKSSRLHTAKILRLSADLPLVIEIVDSEEKIQSFLPVLDQMMGGGLLTMEKVKVIDYRAGNPPTG